MKPAGEAPATGGRWVWVDLRLAPLAAAVWTISLVAPSFSPGQLGGLALAASCLALAVRRGTGAATAVLLVVLAGVAVTSGAAAVRGTVRESSPLRSLAEAKATVSLVLRVDAQFHELTAGRRVVADATVVGLDGPPNRRFDAPVLLFAPADGWRDLSPGQRARVRAGLSLPDRPDDRVAVVAARGPPELVGGPGGVQAAADGLRAGLAASAARALDPGPAGLLPGLVVGDTTAMDEVLEEDFKRAGLSHLTAVSGLTVG